MKRTTTLYLLIVTTASLAIFWLLHLGATLPAPGGVKVMEALSSTAELPEPARS